MYSFLQRVSNNLCHEYISGEGDFINENINIKIAEINKIEAK